MCRALSAFDEEEGKSSGNLGSSFGIDSFARAIDPLNGLTQFGLPGLPSLGGFLHDIENFRAFNTSRTVRG